MADGPRLIGPLPGVGARRVSWDCAGQFAITLSDDNRLLGLSPDGDVWDQPCTGSRQLVWDPAAQLLTVLGELILADTNGLARVHDGGGRLALSPSKQLLSAHINGRVVDIIDHGGSVVTTTPGTCARWNPVSDELAVADDEGVHLLGGTVGSRLVVEDDGERGELEVAWSPGGQYLVVWGSYGSFDVCDTTGSILSAYPAHLRDPNLTAALGTTLLATSGGDGRVVVYDLTRSATHGSLDLGDMATRLELDPTDRFLAITTGSGAITVWDVEANAQVGPLRTPTIATWHPSRPLLGCCDGTDMWLEAYQA